MGDATAPRYWLSAPHDKMFGAMGTEQVPRFANAAASEQHRC